jgi:hypothetical protein
MKKHFTILIVLIASCTISSGQSIPNYLPTNGLIGWWPFNGNANDESGNGNNGTVNGAILTIDRFGDGDKAYSFDGINDIINASSNNLPVGASSRTISFWYFLNSLNQTNDQKVLVGYGGGINCSDWSATLWPITTHPSLDINYNYVSYSNNVQLGSWYHYLATYDSVDGTSIIAPKLYINGILQTNQSTINNTCNINTLTTIPLVIGGGTFGNSDMFFDGKIDDIGIWNRALTQQEISDLYNANICYQTITVTDTLIINTGIITYNPVTFNNTIKIFPNPTNDHITIDYGNFENMNGYQLKIENSLGQQLFQTNITQQTDYLSLNNWGGNGLYFVHIIDPQGNTIDIRKIV